MSENVEIFTEENIEKKRGRPKKYTTTEEANVVRRQQRDEYKERVKERKFQFNTTASKTQLELVKLLSTHVLTDEDFLIDFLTKLLRKI